MNVPSTHSQSFESDFVVPYRLRHDLEWVRREGQNGNWLWVVYDKLSSDFYLMSDLEASVASKLDGKTGARGLLHGADGGGFPYRVDRMWLEQLIARLKSLGLVYECGMQSYLSLRDPPRKRSSRLNSLMSWLQLRISIFNPAHILDLAIGYLAFPFFRIGRGVWLAVLALTLVSVLQHGSRLVVEAPLAASALIADQWWVLLLLLFGIKVCHELGHAVACHAFGAKCREVGVMFLVGVPCFYCDVTDAWRISSAKRRAMIAAAGVYVEIAFAMVAYWVWLTSQIPWVRLTALQVFISSTVMTLAINGNPLLRYDGYYILSDWFGITNLSERARGAWQSICQSVAARELRVDRVAWSDVGLSLYHVLSFAYRWFVLFSLILAARMALIQAGVLTPAVPMWLGAATMLLASQYISGALGDSIALSQRGKYSKKNWSGIAIGMAGTALLLLIPLPRYQTARGVLKPSVEQTLHVRNSSFLVRAMRDGDSVVPGQSIFELKSPEMQRRKLQLEGELQVQQRRVEQLQRRAVDDASVPALLEEAKEKLNGLTEQLEEYEGEAEKLNMKSQFSGRLVLAKKEHGEVVRGGVVNEIYRVFSNVDDHPWFERGELLGHVESVHAWEVQATIQESDLTSLQIGKDVLVRMDQSPRQQWRGRVMRIDRIKEVSKTLPSQVGGNANISQRKEWLLQNDLIGARFRVTIALDRSNPYWLRDGMATIRWQGHSESFADWFRAVFWDARPLGMTIRNFEPFFLVRSAIRTVPRNR
jgi:putative peptide zinc metalloprotease protein